MGRWVGAGGDRTTTGWRQRVAGPERVGAKRGMAWHGMAGVIKRGATPQVLLLVLQTTTNVAPVCLDANI